MDLKSSTKSSGINPKYKLAESKTIKSPIKRIQGWSPSPQKAAIKGISNKLKKIYFITNLVNLIFLEARSITTTEDFAESNINSDSYKLVSTSGMFIRKATL